MTKRDVFFIIIILFLFVLSISAYAHESKKFKAVFTITFNEMTLEEAARMETVIKEKFKDACKIEVDLEDIDGDTYGDVTFDEGSDLILVPGIITGELTADYGDETTLGNIVTDTDMNWGDE